MHVSIKRINLKWRQPARVFSTAQAIHRRQFNTTRRGGAHSHKTLVGAGYGHDADLGVNVEDGGHATPRVRLDTNAREHVVIVLIGRYDVLLEDNLLGIIA